MFDTYAIDDILKLLLECASTVSADDADLHVRGGDVQGKGVFIAAVVSSFFGNHTTLKRLWSSTSGIA